MPITNTDEYIDGTTAMVELQEYHDDIAELVTDLVRLREIRVDMNPKLDGFLYDITQEKIVGCMDKVRDICEELEPLAELEEDIYYFALSEVSLIARDEFENYCFRLVVDCGDISENSSVAAYVDWERFASHIEIDYTSVNFDGEEYLYHS